MDTRRKMPTPGTPKLNPTGISVDKVKARIKELQRDALWQTAQGQWPEISRDKTRLLIVEKLAVEFVAPGDKFVERITLAPVGNFMMGYGPLADLLAVQGEAR